MLILLTEPGPGTLMGDQSRTHFIKLSRTRTLMIRTPSDRTFHDTQKEEG